MKLGLFGGTFDPVHNAHLFVAEAARVELGLERMIFLPTRGSHYRSGPIASIDQRLAMLRGALAPNPHFALDESDLDETATGYTADLMPRLRARYRDDELTFVVGGGGFSGVEVIAEKVETERRSRGVSQTKGPPA